MLSIEGFIFRLKGLSLYCTTFIVGWVHVERGEGYNGGLQLGRRELSLQHNLRNTK